MLARSLLIFTLLVSTDASAQVIGGSPYLAVHGKAKIEVVPDIFPLEITLKETSKDLAKTEAAIESLAVLFTELALKQQVPEADISVSNLSIEPETDYDEKTEKQVFLGNTYAREIKIKFHTLEKLSHFLSAIPAARQIQVQTGAFAYSGTQEARRSLVQAAVKDAKETADELAKAVHKRVAGVHTISNQPLGMRYADGGMTLDTVSVSGVALLAPGTVRATLKRGVINLDQDVYILYALAD